MRDFIKPLLITLAFVVFVVLISPSGRERVLGCSVGADAAQPLEPGPPGAAYPR
jgi:hypothetical protein